MLLQSWVEGRSEEAVRGLRLHDLALDQAFLNVTNLLNDTAWLYTLKDDCTKCPYSLVSKLPAGESTVLKVSSIYSIKARVLNQNLGDYVSASNRTALECSVDSAWQFGEFGIYDLVAQPGGKCSTDTYLQPVNIYLPWFVVIAITIFCFSCYFFAKGTIQSWQTKEVETLDNNNDEIKCLKKKQKEVILTKKQRLKSLDVFRGLSVIPLIFYVNKGGGYEALEHASWEGLPLADWPFPWFLWIMGVCLAKGIKASLERSTSRWNIVKSVLKRSMILFGLGITTNCVSYGLAYETIRMFGVLQRFAIMFLVNGTLFALMWPRNASSRHKGPFADLQALWPQWLLHIVLQIITLCIVFFLPIPGCPTGYFGPGGLSEDRKFVNCTGGAFGYINKLLENESNMENNPTSKAVFGVKAFEPEGPFSNLPSLLTIILGIQAGITLAMYEGWKERISRWIIWGVGCILLAALLHFTFIPVNKQLWTTSFALLTSGGAFLGLSLFYYIVDVKSWWHGFPFLEPGSNSLVMYVGSRLTINMWPWHWRIGPMDTHFVLLLDTFWACWLWLLLAKWLYKRKIFVTV